MGAGKLYLLCMYAIVDIETTGGSPRNHRITEIAVLLHDGNRIVREFSTLVYPECRIPYHISSLTGITDEMVAKAPRFCEIARELVELTEGASFVAHNVNFDYGFVQHEFSRLGYDYRRNKLCTVSLSRKLIPGHRSYSLGRLCEDLNIHINGRHRALGDAMATAVLFELLIKADSETGRQLIGERAGETRLPLTIDPAQIRELPQTPGVYYFYNAEGDLIYIGKSKNIQSRVFAHLRNENGSKAARMKNQIASLSYEETGNELIALLRESNEIKVYKPLYNRAQRRALFRYGLYSFRNQGGYICFFLDKTQDVKQSPLASYSTKAEARQALNNLIDDFRLCQHLCGLYPGDKGCFHYQIGLCKGACLGIESPAEYNSRAQAAEDQFAFGFENLIIIDRGRNPGEKAVVKIENGKYAGFGYFHSDFLVADPTLPFHCIRTYPDNREVQQIIRQYLRKNKPEQLIRF